MPHRLQRAPARILGPTAWAALECLASSSATFSVLAAALADRGIRPEPGDLLDLLDQLRAARYVARSLSGRGWVYRITPDGLEAIQGTPSLPPPAEPSLPPPPPISDPIAAELLALHNQARAAIMSPPLVVDVRLMAAAQLHAADVASRLYLGNMHRGSDGSDVARRVTRQGYPWRAVGENAQQFPGNWPGGSMAENAVDAWMNSPGHRRNIEDPNFREVGFGVGRGPDGRSVWIAVFGSRQV